MILRVVALLCIAIAAVELGLRFVGFGDPPVALPDPELEYRMVPEQSYRRFGNTVEVNTLGLRAPEFAARPAPGRTRVLLIGDSVIYGTHDIDQSDMISEQMTQSCPGLEVVPIALSSWGPVNQAAFLERYGTFGAQAAFLVVSSHDLFDTPGFTRADIPYRTRKSFGAIDDVSQSAIAKLWPRPAPPPQAPLETRRAQTLAALGRIEAQLRESGVPLTLVYHPTIPERAQSPSPARAAFADWARNSKVTFLDLTDTPPGIYIDHIHPAADGAAGIALILIEALGDTDACTPV